MECQQLSLNDIRWQQMSSVVIWWQQYFSYFLTSDKIKTCFATYCSLSRRVSIQVLKTLNGNIQTGNWFIIATSWLQIKKFFSTAHLAICTAHFILNVLLFVFFIIVLCTFGTLCHGLVRTSVCETSTPF